MKTSKILTLLVLAVFAMSFSTALSQEKKTRRQIKKEQEAEQKRDVLGVIASGDFVIAKYATHSYPSPGFTRRSGLGYAADPTPMPTLNKSPLIRRLSHNVYIHFAFMGVPDSVMCDVEMGRYQFDVVCYYTLQGQDQSQRFVVGFSADNGCVRISPVYDQSKCETVFNRGLNYLYDEVYAMSEEDGINSNDVTAFYKTINSWIMHHPAY